MDNKFYISYEAARLLKEKGYDEKVEYMYDDNILTSIDVLTNSQIDRYYRNMYGIEFYGAPTKSQAIDWLDRKGLVIVLSPATITQKDGTNIIFWRFYVVRGTEGWYNNYGDYKTRLEAEEAAIIKALELL